MFGENASNRCTRVDYNVERLKNHLVASQDLSNDLSTDIFSPKVGLAYKKEDAGRQVFTKPKIKDSQSNLQIQTMTV